MVNEGGKTMGDKVQTWRVVLTDGDMIEVPVECIGEDSYLARFRHTAAWGGTPRLAVLRLASECFGEAAEIVSPDGNEARAKMHALRNERGVILREVIRLRAENAMLREELNVSDAFATGHIDRLSNEVTRLRSENATLRASTDAAVDGVRAMLPAALRVAREEGEAAAREWAANVCERMVVGGCAWSEEQAIAGRALLAAAEHIRTLPIAARYEVTP